MLLISDRVSPCRARLSRSSLGRFTSRAPSPFSTVMGAATAWVRVPLGPLTVTMFAWTCTSTPDGTGTGSLPMRDIASTSASSSCSGSPDVGEDFPTYTLAVGLTVGEQALAGRDDRDTEAAEHLGQRGVLGVHAQAGLADPAYAGDGALTVAAVLELDLQRLADHVLVVRDVEGGDVALLLEDLGQALLQLAVGHRHRVVVRLVGVAQTRQHVCDRVGHGHGVCRSLFCGFRPAVRRRTFSGCRTGSPAGLGDAGELAAVGHLAQADPAQAELAVDGLGAAAALAAGVPADGELGRARRLHLQGILRHVSSP